MSSEENLPANIQAEQALLGAIFINNGCYNKVADFLAPAHFSEPLHQRIFEIMETMFRASSVVTPITIKAFMDDKIDGMSIPKYLARLCTEGELAAMMNPADYGRQIYDFAVRRGLIKVGAQLQRDAHAIDPSISGPSLAEKAVGSLVEIMHAQSGPSENMSSVSLAERSLRLAVEARDKGTVSGIHFGFPAIDELAGPILPGQLVVIAGDTKMGKTVLSTQLGYMFARQGQVVSMRSLEMQPAEINDRLVCALSNINAEDLRKAEWIPAEQGRLQAALDEMAQAPLYISGKGKESVDSIRAWAVNQKKYKGAKLLIIDQLRFVDVPRVRDKFEKIGEAVLEIKDIAATLDIPIILCSQLNRGVRPPETYSKIGCIGRPMLSHLYGASEIEQTADTVLFVHRPEHYLLMTEPSPDSGKARADWGVEMLRWGGKAEIICAVRRSGKSFQVRETECHLNRSWFGPYDPINVNQPGLI